MAGKPAHAEDVGLKRSLRRVRKRLDRLRKEIRRKKNRDPRWKF